jgi:hypothetical protein
VELPLGGLHNDVAFRRTRLSWAFSGLDPLHDLVLGHVVHIAEDEVSSGLIAGASATRSAASLAGGCRLVTLDSSLSAFSTAAAGLTVKRH